MAILKEICDDWGKDAIIKLSAITELENNIDEE